MAEERLQRRLAAILSADVVGYSRLMGLDEARTLSRLNALRRKVFDPTVAAHSGRIVKLMGDGALVEFASAVNAVTCAIEIQRLVGDHNTDDSQVDPIRFRIGINVGDIIIEGEDIYGDGVNIAARLEGIAEPGGIYLSRAVHEQVAGKVAAAFTEVGVRNLKNIDTPVHVFRVGERVEGSQGSTLPPLISDRPSIAVLPFSSLSQNRNLELLADGLVEDVIALLARVPGFFVISRSSSFAYRNTTQDVRYVGRELGVRYVVEGSIRASDKRTRILTELVEAESGKQIWTQRFDVELADTFDLQDEIAHQIIRELEPELTRAELTLIQRQRPDNLDAWSRYRQALGAIVLNGWNEEALAKAITHLRDAIALDPNFALAHAMVALLGAINANMSFAEDRFAAQQQALRDAETAVSLDPNASEVLGYAGCALSDIGELTRGREWLERAIEIDPSNAQAHVALGAAQVQRHELDAGIKAMQHGIRLSPRDAKLPFWGMVLAAGLARADRLLEAALAETLNSCRRDGRLYGARVIAAFVLLRLGREREARAAMTEARRIRPALSIEEIQHFFGRYIARDLVAIWSDGTP
jgi:adenylate cyclase